MILSWNRAHLLDRTVHSLLSTISVGYELFIVDNASTDRSRAVIESVCGTQPNHHSVLMPSNIPGGEAANIGMKRAQGRYIMLSENDVEYHRGWDTELLRRFEVFPELGQLSPYSPFPQVEAGEVWEKKPAALLTRDGLSIYVAEGNVTTTSMIRREVYDRGARWVSYGNGRFKFPADGQFSADVKKLGYLVAWSPRYVATNWGHNIEEMQENVEYYVENYSSKSWFGLEGYMKRLRQHGFRLVMTGGKYSIVRAESETSDR